MSSALAPAADWVYDFGMNNGDDVEYYLKKGLRVVAVEANPALCDLAAKRFANEIVSRRLVILNIALSGQSTAEPITFFVHRRNHVLSQVSTPAPESIADFDAIEVSQRGASDVVREYGRAHYIKIDLEGLDDVVLADLFAAGIRPDFISAEVHSVKVFALLVANGYESFNLVDGATVYEVYANARIATAAGAVAHAFKKHSAGPFGEDIATPWWDADRFVYVLASARLGWKDVHASKTIRPTASRPVPIELSLRDHLQDLGPSVIRWLKAKMGRRRRQ